MRTAFIKTLEKLAEKNKKIFLLNGDLGFSVLEDFTNKFPGRSINMGVAEANMAGVAAGLSYSGKIVFIYSIIPFVTARIFEQIRNDISVSKANVKIVGVGSGFSYGQLGPTHHAIEDISLMRSLPFMTVLAPGDPAEVVCATKAAAQINGPVYLRLGKKAEPYIHRKKLDFKIGKGIIVLNGKDITVITTGNMLAVGKEIAYILHDKGINVRLISMHTVKPIDKVIINKAARETEAIFTIEEHNIIGGLGSAVSEILSEGNSRVIFKRFGVKDRFTLIAGSQDYLRKNNGLSSKKISQEIVKRIKKKL